MAGIEAASAPSINPRLGSSSKPAFASPPTCAERFSQTPDGFSRDQTNERCWRDRPFGRSPLSRASRPFVRPTLKVAFGSRVRIAGTTPRGHIFDTREAAPSFRARLAQTGSAHHRPRSQDNGPCSRSSCVQEATGPLARLPVLRRLRGWCGARHGSKFHPVRGSLDKYSMSSSPS
jgi:hypothetical protein